MPAMAMNVGAPSRSSDPDVMIDINTTPLIDVMLVLLVMLIITIPIQLHAVNLNLPIGNPPPPLTLPDVVKIDVDDQSKVYWNGEVVADRATLESKMSEAAKLSVQPEVHLRPNKLAKYAVVAGVMASAQRLGLTKIGIVGSEQFIGE
jgi:biopolymer transport protein ExbD